MAFERHWEAVPPVAFTALGSSQGVATVTSTKGFKVKMVVTVDDPLQPLRQFEIKRVISPTQMVLGRVGESINDKSDLSVYGPAGPSMIYSLEQPKRLPSPKEIDEATYSQEPTVARRVTLVDRYGRLIDAVVDPNGVLRLAVDANITAEADLSIDWSSVPLITNIPIVTAGAEIAFTFPVKTGKFTITTRDGNAAIKIGLTAGSTSTGPFYKLPRGTENFSHEISRDPPPPALTLYLSGDKVGAVIQIWSWSAP